MCRFRSNHCALLVAVGILFVSTTANTTEIKPNASFGMRYTDNIRKVAENEKKELIAISSIGASIKEDTGPLKLDANTSLKYMDYTQDNFNNQAYFNLNAKVNWAMLKDRLSWKVQDFFTQQSINSLNPDTPDNTADTNVFTFGPVINYRISGRQSLTITPEYRRYDYEDQIIDSQQNALNVSWNYQFYRTLSVGVRGEVNEVDYNDQQLTDNTFKKIHLTLSGKRPNYDLSAEIGATRGEKKDLEDVQGISGNIRWFYNINGLSNLRAHITTDLTDSNNSLLNASVNPGDGGFTNEHISADISRNSIIWLAYQRSDATLISKIWIELRQQKGVFPIGRRVQEVGLEFNYPLTAAVSTGVNTRYSRVEITDGNRNDTDYSIGGNVSYRFSRKLLGVVDIKYFDRDSSDNTAGYSEVNIFANLVYGYGS